MKKALKSSLAVILALTMLVSCAFAFSASAAGAASASAQISIADVPEIITGLVKTAVAAAKYAYFLYETYVPEEVKDINADIAENVTDSVKNLVTVSPTIVTIDGKEYDITSLKGLISVLGKLETEQQKTYVGMKYVELLFSKIIQFIADLIPLPSGLTALEDYEAESGDFYKGSESFVSEPAADAKWQLGYSQASLVPDDVLNGNYYLAGYLLQNFPSNTVETVLDDMKVRTVVLDDGRGKVVFSTIECIGLANADVRQIRARVEKELKDSGIISVNVFATHCHSCIDTQGLWNPFFLKMAKNIGVSITGLGEYSTGTNPEYMEFLYDTTVDTIVEACENMEVGELYEATMELTEDYIKDDRGVFDAVSNLTRLRFDPDDESVKETYIVNMSAHPYITGLKTDKSSGKELSADYTYYMEEIISSAENNNTNFMFVNGALCGIYSARGVTNDGVDTVRRSEEATRYGHELGRMVIAMDMTVDEIKAAGDWLTNDSFYEEQAQLIKENAELTDEEKEEKLENLSIWYENWTPVEETKVDPILNIRHKEVVVRITNPIIEAVGKCKLVNNTIYYDEDENLYTVTEIGYLEIGKNIKIALLPGEVAPELVTGNGACLAENSYSGTDFGYPSINSIVSDYCGEEVELFVFGEANDACGYVVPDNDYCMVFFDDSNVFGDHYQESISFGYDAASTLVKGYMQMMEELKK